MQTPAPRFRPAPRSPQVSLAYAWAAALVWATSGALVTLPARASRAQEQPQSSSTPAARLPIHIVTLGDSITRGERAGVPASATFAAQIELQLTDLGHAVRVTNAGRGGERTDQALRRLEQVLALKPDVVTVMYGTNDSYVDEGQAASRLSLEAYTRNLERLVTELLGRGILTVLMTEPRWSDQAGKNGVGENPNLRLEPYVDACRTVAAKWRVPLVDHFSHWTKARADGVQLHDWTTDGCHPNPTGHRELSRVILPVLQTTLGPSLKTRASHLASRPVRIVCFGDSVTGVYYHTGSRRAYTDVLGDLLRASGGGPVEMINAGISGHTTADGLVRLEKDVLRHRPDLVTVMFGLNDMTRVPLAKYRENLRSIVDRCRSAGVELVLATPNNVIDTAGRPEDRLVEYCDVVRQLADELNVPLCDCYRELAAARAIDPLQWRLMMSDEIHPNMDGHRRIAALLARTILGSRPPVQEPAMPAATLAHAGPLLEAGKAVRVLAMPPADEIARRVLRERFPECQLEVTSWPVAGRTLQEIELDSKSRVRAMKPDLVLIAVPSSAAASSPEAFAKSFAWTMNWSLNFGPPTWDCVVLHPSVFEAPGQSESSGPQAERAHLIRQLVRAQDLPLIDRPADDSSPPEALFRTWLRSLGAQ